MEITEIIKDACDKRLFSCSVYLGLKKVFDTVNCPILLAKANHYGVRGVANDWIRSLIYNTIQYIIVNNTGSELILYLMESYRFVFLIFINDLRNSVKRSSLSF